MSMTVRIKIGGSVIAYDKDGNWNFVFVSDDRHRVNLIVVGGRAMTLRTAGKSRMLRLNLSPGHREWIGESDKILNMGDARLHDADRTNSYLEVLSPPATPVDREIVRLTVPAGTVDGSDFYPDYFSMPYPGSGPFTSHGETAKYMILEFEISKDLEVIEGTKGFPVGSFEEGKVMDITIDNDCKCTGHPDDFLVYYDWVRDISDCEKKFVARKTNNSGSIVLKSLEGNCDPTRIVPPPFP